MNEIWANRLIAGTKTWEQVPASRKDGVLEVLRARMDKGAITAAKFTEVTGVEVPAAETTEETVGE